MSNKHVTIELRYPQQSKRNVNNIVSKHHTIHSNRNLKRNTDSIHAHKKQAKKLYVGL